MSVHALRVEHRSRAEWAPGRTYTPQSGDSPRASLNTSRATTKAAVFVAPARIELQHRAIPDVGLTDALSARDATTICGTDVHILKGEYTIQPGRILGHEPVGIIVAVGAAVTGYRVGQRVISGAITPCGQCEACLDGHGSQCGRKAIGGWKLGNTIDELEGAESDGIRLTRIQQCEDARRRQAKAEGPSSSACRANRTYSVR